MKAHDWSSCKHLAVFRGFESLPLRQGEDMSDTAIAGYYTLVILVYLGIWYSVFKHRKSLLNTNAADTSIRVARILRLGLIAGVLIWGTMSTVGVWNDTIAIALPIVWIVILLIVATLLIPWERVLKIGPIIIYVYFILITALYIALISIIQNVFFGGPPGT